MTVLILFSLRRFFKFTCNFSFKPISTFENGSSKSNKDGFDRRDLTKEALCASPALISCGNFFKILSN